MTQGKTRWRGFSLFFGSSLALVVGGLVVMSTTAHAATTVVEAGC